MRKQSLAARLDRLGPARETAQIGAVRIRPVFSHSLWTRNRKQLVAASRSHGWRQATPSGSGGLAERRRCCRRPAIDLA
jgi:hypothetical protein